MFLFILLLALLGGQIQVARAQQVGEPAPPFRQDELVSYIQTKAFTQQQLVDLVESRGIAFRLNDGVRRELQKAGASKPLLEAVQKAYDNMRRATTAEEKAATAAALAAAPKPASPPPALEDDAAVQLIESVRKNALAYTDRLPDFLCLQVTRRMADWNGSGYWQLLDVVQTRVGYNEHHETYQVVAVNNTPVTDKNIESLGGAVSTGEFGSILRDVFHPETQARFRMVGPATLRGRPVYAYDYDVERDHSRWHITWERGRAGERSDIPAYRGRVIVDAESHEVLRLWLQALDLPSDFPIRAAASTLDYDYARIGERPFLLPARAVMEMKDSRVATRNEISFRQYRKFSTETKLVFEDIPENAPPGEQPKQPGQQPGTAPQTPPAQPPAKRPTKP